MDYIPVEILYQIVYIKCALIIQRMWRRYDMFAHCRSRKWLILKRFLGLNNVLELSLYSGVRREWRDEIDNWMNIDGHDVSTIISECNMGLWGRRLQCL